MQELSRPREVFQIGDFWSTLQVTAATQLVAGVREMSAELWQRLEAVYEAAQEKGALYRIHTRPEPLRDAVLGLHFQLQISEALRDKPKAKPERCASTWPREPRPLQKTAPSTSVSFQREMKHESILLSIRT